MLAQLACEVKVLRPVSRQVFRPVPNVDSVLLGLTGPARPPGPALSALVHGAFAHRRKTLAGSLALAAGAGGPGRRRGRRARVSGRADRARPPARRPRRASVPAAVPGARGAAVAMTVLERERAYAKINLCLFLGPTRPDGRHQLVTLFDSVGLC